MIECILELIDMIGLFLDDDFELIVFDIHFIEIIFEIVECSG
jgi:hypothetical protein